jgi:hypothetical protein
MLFICLMDEPIDQLQSRINKMKKDFQLWK